MYTHTHTILNKNNIEQTQKQDPEGASGAKKNSKVEEKVEGKEQKRINDKKI